MKIIDLHTHILPGMDDGADTMATALQMLKNAQASNVAALAVTPHCNIPGWVDNFLSGAFLLRLRNLRSAAEEAGIPVKILAGMEVRASEDLPALLKEGKLLTLNGSRYLLTEFTPDVTPESCKSTLQSLLTAGVIPLVAHPERYHAVGENPEMVQDWLDMGCHIQVTGGSILGKFGREAYRTADHLLRRNLVACVASDAHGTNRRSNYLANAYDHLSLHLSRSYANMVLFDNPYRICQNETL